MPLTKRKGRLTNRVLGVRNFCEHISQIRLRPSGTGATGTVLAPYMNDMPLKAININYFLLLVGLH
jgi:hypothetical protein